MRTLTKANPYGADIPSAIPRPPAGGGEWVPPPERLSGAWNLIPLNDRNTLAVMRGYLNSQEPKVARWLYATWNAEREAIKYQELVGATVSGELPMSWIAQWQEDYSKFVVEELDPQWRKAMESAGNKMGEGIEAYAGKPFGFTPTGARIEEWISTRGGELAANLSQAQHDALRSILRYYTVDKPVSPQELGRIIRPVIGLTPKQTEAVRKFRENLVVEGLTQKQIDQQVGSYTSWLHRIRAERVARTELSMSYNYGQFDAVRQAQEQGFFGGPVAKIWMTAEDERVCDFCGPLDGQVVELEGTFPGMTIQMPNVYTPPAHPSCRCSTAYSVLEKGAMV